MRFSAQILILLFSLITIPSNISAQTKTLGIDEEFLCLKNGTILFTNQYSIKYIYPKKRFYDSSGSEISRNAIRFVRIKNSLYGMINNELVKAKGDGEVKLYVLSKNHYYSKGLEFIKILDYPNLHSDLVINHLYEDDKDRAVIESRLLFGSNVNKYRFIAGFGGLGTMFIGALVATSTDNGPNLITATGGLIITAGLLSTMTALVTNERIAYKRAVNYFNETQR